MQAEEGIDNAHQHISIRISDGHRMKVSEFNGVIGISYKVVYYMTTLSKIICSLLENYGGDLGDMNNRETIISKKKLCLI